MNDAKGYFHQIQHTFAVLVLMYYGVAWSMATTLFEVLQKAMPKIKLAMEFLLLSIATRRLQSLVSVRAMG